MPPTPSVRRTPTEGSRKEAVRNDIASGSKVCGQGALARADMATTLPRLRGWTGRPTGASPSSDLCSRSTRGGRHPPAPPLAMPESPAPPITGCWPYLHERPLRDWTIPCNDTPRNTRRRSHYCLGIRRGAHSASDPGMCLARKAHPLRAMTSLMGSCRASFWPKSTRPMVRIGRAIRGAWPPA